MEISLRLKEIFKFKLYLCIMQLSECFVLFFCRNIAHQCQHMLLNGNSSVQFHECPCIYKAHFKSAVKSVLQHNYPLICSGGRKPLKMWVDSFSQRTSVLPPEPPMPYEVVGLVGECLIEK